MSYWSTLNKNSSSFYRKSNIMKWQFSVSQGSINLSLNAELICRTHQMEQIKITGKNISFILLGNRPLIEGAQRSYPVSWRVFYGDMKDEKLLQSIAKQVEQHIKQSADNKKVSMFTEVRKTA